jgi:hypothetical protein
MVKPQLKICGEDNYESNEAKGVPMACRDKSEATVLLQRKPSPHQ